MLHSSDHFESGRRRRMIWRGILYINEGDINCAEALLTNISIDYLFVYCIKLGLHKNERFGVDNLYARQPLPNLAFLGSIEKGAELYCQTLDTKHFKLPFIVPRQWLRHFCGTTLLTLSSRLSRFVGIKWSFTIKPHLVPPKMAKLYVKQLSHVRHRAEEGWEWWVGMVCGHWHCQGPVKLRRGTISSMRTIVPMHHMMDRVEECKPKSRRTKTINSCETEPTCDIVENQWVADDWWLNCITIGGTRGLMNTGFVV